MQIVNGVTANKMLQNGFSCDDIIHLGKICGLSYGNLSDYDKSFLNDLKDKNVFVFTNTIVKNDDIITSYCMKSAAYAHAFVSSHLIVFSGNYQDNREYYYDNIGNKILLTVYK